MGILNIRNKIETFSQIKRKRVSWYHVIWEETIYFCVVSAPLSWLSSTPKSLLAVWFLPNIANILQLTFILGWNLSEKREKFSFYNSWNTWNKLYCNQTNVLFAYLPSSPEFIYVFNYVILWYYGRCCDSSIFIHIWFEFLTKMCISDPIWR